MGYPASSGSQNSWPDRFSTEFDKPETSTCLPIFELHYRRFFKNTAVRLAVPWREPNNFNNFTAKFELFFVLTQENASS